MLQNFKAILVPIPQIALGPQNPKYPGGRSLKLHAIIDLSQNLPKRTVSFIFLHLMDHLMDIEGRQQELDWNITGVNAAGLSENPGHKFIHFKYMLLQLFISTEKLSSHTYCTLGVLFIFLLFLTHRLLEAPKIVSFGLLYKKSKIWVDKVPLSCFRIRLWWISWVNCGGQTWSGQNRSFNAL